MASLIQGLRTYHGEDEARLLTALAWAESGGNKRAVNRNTNGTRDIGLWQINTVHLQEGGLLAEPQGQIEFTEETLKYPFVNWTAMRTIKDAQGLSAWVAYNTGAYKKFLGKDMNVNLLEDGRKSVAEKVTGAAGSVADEALGPLDEIAGGVGDAVKFLLDPQSWLPISKVVLGGGLIIIGTAAIVFVVANKAGATPVGKVTSLGKVLK